MTYSQVYSYKLKEYIYNKHLATEVDIMEHGRRVDYTDDILKIENKDEALARRIKKFKKLYPEIMQLQDIINTYGCNMKILLECLNIPNLKENGNEFHSCEEICKDKEKCDFYKTCSRVYK